MTNSLRASDVIGSRVRELRQWRGLTRDDLAQRCEALGAEITAAVLVNIETGRPDKQTGKRRRDVTVDELLVLALALDVPPVYLVLPLDPLGEQRTWLQVTPRYEISAWGTLFWISGESERFIPSDNDDGSVPLERRRAWREASQPVRMYRAWLGRFDMAGNVEKYGEAGKLSLAEALNQMLASGINPPPTPDDWVAVMRENGWLDEPDEVPVQPKE